MFLFFRISLLQMSYTNVRKLVKGRIKGKNLITIFVKINIMSKVSDVYIL